MIKNFTLLCCAVIFATVLKAQVYTQGDITVTPQPQANHDSTSCSTSGQMVYFITIQNSFMGDSVKVVDPTNNYFYYAAGNNTGQATWIVTVPILPWQFDDELVNGGILHFATPVHFCKVISGSDTIYNINNDFDFPVNNACEYGPVSGRVYVDYNNNCVFDSSDNGLVGVMPTVWAHVNSPNLNDLASGSGTGGLGLYYTTILKSWVVSYDVSIPASYQFIFPSSGCSPASYHFTTVPQTNVDFSLQCSSNVDVQCYAYSPGFARPGIPLYLSPGVNNTGCDTVSGTLRLILDANVTYNSGLSSNPANTVSGDTLIWDYSTLSSLSNGAYWNSFFAGVYLTLNNTVAIGDTLCFSVFTEVPAADINAANNSYTVCIPVVNSYDPNLKEVSPKGKGTQGFIPASTPELEYTIHFQNTGNAVAFNVNLVDTLDEDILPGSLQIIAADHAMSPEWLSANVVRFNFSNINLPDSGSNEAASHGTLSFKVKTKPSLLAGTQIKNTAAIYFDSNAPIFTNTTLNTIENNTGITSLPSTTSFSVHPNPATTSVTITTTNEMIGSTITVADIMGRKVLAAPLSTANRELSTDFPNGIYLLTLTAPNGKSATKKLVISK